MGIRNWNRRKTVRSHSISTSSTDGWTLVSGVDTIITTKRGRIEQYQVETDLDAIREEDPSLLMNMKHMEAWNILPKGAEPVEHMEQTWNVSPTETLSFTIDPATIAGRPAERISRIHTRIITN